MRTFLVIVFSLACLWTASGDVVVLMTGKIACVVFPKWHWLFGTTRFTDPVVSAIFWMCVPLAVMLLGLLAVYWPSTRHGGSNVV